MEQIKRKDTFRAANVDGMTLFSRHCNGVSLKRTKLTSRLSSDRSLRDITSRTSSDGSPRDITSRLSSDGSLRDRSVPFTTISETSTNTMTKRRSFTIRREHTTLTNHLVRESTFTKEIDIPSTCDSSESRLRIKQEVKSILKCSEVKSVYHDSAEKPSAHIDDVKNDTVFRCSYRLPVSRQIKMHKAVSFRDDLVVRRFKQFDVLCASG